MLGKNSVNIAGGHILGQVTEQNTFYESVQPRVRVYRAHTRGPSWRPKKKYFENEHLTAIRAHTNEQRSRHQASRNTVFFFRSTTRIIGGRRILRVHVSPKNAYTVSPLFDPISWFVT